MEKLKPLDSQQIQSLGLDISDVEKHRKRLNEALSQNKLPTISIKETCTIENQGILKPDSMANTTTEHHINYAAFIPAAGAASRYFKPFSELIKILKTRQVDSLESTIGNFKNSNPEYQSWCLPSLFETFIKAEPTKQKSIFENQADELVLELTQAKAFLPCTTDGISFLEMKLIEHEKFDEITGQAFVVPPGQSSTFIDKVSRMNQTSKPISFFEQGAAI